MGERRRVVIDPAVAAVLGCALVVWCCCAMAGMGDDEEG